MKNEGKEQGYEKGTEWRASGRPVVIVRTEVRRDGLIRAIVRDKTTGKVFSTRADRLYKNTSMTRARDIRSGRFVATADPGAS